MITLITGSPGSGKSLYVVSTELQRSEYENRPLFVDGIPDLKLPHHPFPASLDEWHKWVPHDGIIVCDEVQKFWRPRHQSSKVPECIQALETHRGREGCDFILITQHPRLLDGNVRALVGRHIHVRRLFGGPRAVLYEWDSATDPKQVSNAQKRMWPYPKKAYALYKSAEVHTARTNRLPFMVPIFAFAALLFLTMSYQVYQRLFNKEPVEVIAESAPVPGARASAPGNGHEVPSLLTPADYEKLFQPIHPDHPESAPAYDHLRVVKVMPTIAACISSEKSCTCYTAQLSPITTLSDDQCRLRTLTPEFNPYLEPPEKKRANNDV